MEQLDLIQIKNPICKIIIRKIVYEKNRESFKHFLWGEVHLVFNVHLNHCLIAVKVTWS